MPIGSKKILESHILENGNFWRTLPFFSSKIRLGVVLELNRHPSNVVENLAEELSFGIALRLQDANFSASKSCKLT